MLILAVLLAPDAPRAQNVPSTGAASTLTGHVVVLDSDGRILSWVEPQANAFGSVADKDPPKLGRGDGYGVIGR
jgi:hypothetical protein